MPDYKARLVDQGCQEDKGYIRTDAPTGSRDAFFMTFSSSKRLGLLRVRCSVSVLPVRRHRETIAVADASQKSASWDEARASVATGSIYGTRDAGRARHEHSKKVLEAAGFVESSLEQDLYYLHGPSGLEAVVHTHVDDFLSAFRKVSKKYNDAFQKLVHELHLIQQPGLVVYCGRTICRDGNHNKVTHSSQR